MENLNINVYYKVRIALNIKFVIPSAILINFLNMNLLEKS